MPIVREPDGLAISFEKSISNTSTKRKSTLSIKRTVQGRRKMIQEGERSVEMIKSVFASEMAEVDMIILR
jgi:pantothenate synthetase